MSVNLYNLSQGIVYTLYCVYIENMAARGGAGTAVKKQNLFCLWRYPSIQQTC